MYELRLSRHMLYNLRSFLKIELSASSRAFGYIERWSFSYHRPDFPLNGLTLLW